MILIKRIHTQKGEDIRGTLDVGTVREEYRPYHELFLIPDGEKQVDSV